MDFIVHIPRSQLRQIERHVLSTPAHEQCGFLVGRPGLGSGSARCVCVERVASAQNIATDAESFAISPLEQRQLLADLGPGEELIGVYHSHLGAPEPSPDDLVSMQLVPLIWLIVGPTRPAHAKTLEYRALSKRAVLQSLRVSGGR